MDTINSSHLRAQEWLKGLLEIQKSTGSSLEFIENVKIDLFPDEVYVFTPKGSILELPNGASAVDYAYAIHTDIGDTCVAAKINRRLAPLSTQLASGQTVEIITSPNAQPNPAWLNFVITGKARSAIRHFLKKQRKVESIALGRRLIERALSTLSLSLKQLSEDNIQYVLKESHFETIEQLFESTGLGAQVPLIVARRLAFVVKEEHEEEEHAKQIATDVLSRQPLIIEGTEGMVVKFASCCQPIPGDVIVGILEAGRGIVVHCENCNQIRQLRRTEKCIFLTWEENIKRDFSVDVTIHTINRRGVLANLAMAIADAEANIEDITVEEGDGRYSIVHLTLSVRDRLHLAGTMRRIRVVKDVSKIIRKK